MKRIIVLGLVLAILAVGLTALADPINVGGSFTGSSSPTAENTRLGSPLPPTWGAGFAPLCQATAVAYPFSTVMGICTPLICSIGASVF